MITYSRSLFLVAAAALLAGCSTPESGRVKFETSKGDFVVQVNKEWAPEKVASAFGVSVDYVYVAKHRITELIKDEVRRLERKMT